MLKVREIVSSSILPLFQFTTANPAARKQGYPPNSPRSPRKTHQGGESPGKEYPNPNSKPYLTTPYSGNQAVEAGDRLLKLLKPEDTVRIITSPYTRTRETTNGIISSLAPHPNSSKIKVLEEPRIREQDFGNFQPCSEEMERMWHERAAYGHFFYRIPNGESAADAYDRVSGFNESIWRQFAEDDFPSVLVLVTHGLMTRIFLMKWWVSTIESLISTPNFSQCRYHYSVEYFENLRNVNHCEFVLMEKDAVTDKYILQNKLRTWSAYRKEQEERRSKEGGVSKEWKKLEAAMSSRVAYGGCVNGCNHPKPNGVNGNSHTSGNVSMNRGNEALVQELRDKLKVLEAGRDFGGSRSGSGSRLNSEDESSSSDDEIPLSQGVGGGYIGIRGGECSSEPSDIVEKLSRQDQGSNPEGLDQTGERGGVKL